MMRLARRAPIPYLAGCHCGPCSVYHQIVVNNEKSLIGFCVDHNGANWWNFRTGQMQSVQATTEPGFMAIPLAPDLLLMSGGGYLTVLRSIMRRGRRLETSYRVRMGTFAVSDGTRVVTLLPAHDVRHIRLTDRSLRAAARALHAGAATPGARESNYYLVIRDLQSGHADAVIPLVQGYDVGDVPLYQVIVVGRIVRNMVLCDDRLAVRLEEELGQQTSVYSVSDGCVQHRLCEPGITAFCLSRNLFGAALSPRGCVVFWHLATAPVRLTMVSSIRTLDVGNVQWCSHIALTPDDMLACTCTDSGILRLWCMVTATCLHTIREGGRNVCRIGITPDYVVAVDTTELRAWTHRRPEPSVMLLLLAARRRRVPVPPPELVARYTLTPP